MNIYTPHKTSCQTPLQGACLCLSPYHPVKQENLPKSPRYFSSGHGIQPIDRDLGFSRPIFRENQTGSPTINRGIVDFSFKFLRSDDFSERRK